MVLSILIVLLSSTSSVLANAHSAQSTYTQKAQQLLNKMTPEEKVGQLFLITFHGDALSEDSELFSLMQDYQIGGVVLTRANENFTGPENTLESATALIAQLQQRNWENSLSDFANEEMEQTKNNYVPLFIGISQDGDSYPFDQILSGLSTVPNQMAIGATFSTDLAKSNGELLGRELQAVGFYLFWDLLWMFLIPAILPAMPVWAHEPSEVTRIGLGNWVNSLSAVCIPAAIQNWS